MHTIRGTGKYSYTYWVFIKSYGKENMSQIPLKELKKVHIRAEELCEICGSTGGSWGLQHAHILHRKLGGRHGAMAKLINDSRNVWLGCNACHWGFDHGKFNESVVETLKKKLDWYSWEKEYKEILNSLGVQRETLTTQ